MRLQRDREQLLPHLELKNASRGGEQERRFHRNTTKSASRGQAASTAIRSRVTVVRFQRQHARRQLRFARRHSAGRAELHLRSRFWRRHACRNGRTSSASTSLARRSFAWGNLAWGNFARGSYTGGLITSTSARASPGARACIRTIAYTCFCAPKASNGHANRGTVGITPAVTRSRAASLLPVPVAKRYVGGRNNNRATLAELFEAGTL